MFVEKAKVKHANRYDYCKVEYVNSQTKVCIVCDKHGDFWQRPNDHLNGSGCPLCKREKLSQTKTLGFSIEKAREIHGDKYDYSKVVFVNCDTKVTIICPEHGDFEKTPYSHINQKSGCQKCWSDKRRYLNSERNKKNTLTKEMFLSKCVDIHGDLYSYDLVDYVSMRTPIKILCKKHGEFEQSPHNHIYNANGCPKCISKSESELFDYISSLVPCEKTREHIGGLEIDCYVPDKRIGFEFNGLRWHSSLYKEDTYHLQKTDKAESEGIHLIHIYEDDWRDNRTVVESRIKNVLGMIDRRIFARCCDVRVVDSKECRSFLNDNHIQGYVGSPIALGLYHNNELVSIMTLGKMRRNLGISAQEEGQYELLRFCNRNGLLVVGAASKLFKHFIDKYSPIQIISYADRSWSSKLNNTVYDILGFDFVGTTRPNYHYVVDAYRKDRFAYRKDILVKDGYDPNKSERQIMNERGVPRIYDSGNLKFVWTKHK